ncbi:MAG: tryptophan--tRNA ligase [Alphaproteobacteria bacterium]|nr:tryptophan--tRNA ligase [Alphaproteobacteria bacterium]
MSDNKLYLTGVKPTGDLHFGNYIGAIKQACELSQENKMIVFIADLHALNAVHDAKVVRENTYKAAAVVMSLGFNMDNVLLFRQSDVDAVYKLTELLMNVTPKGLMDRAHSYKASVDKNTAAGLDVDAGVNMGLYTYPILMAADILLYDTDVVPVGADQKQHVEFARDIAGHFNTVYGNVFKLPDVRILPNAGVLPGLDGRKMSKSYGNEIALMSSQSELKKKIMRIITDSKTPEESKDPETSTVFQIYRHFATVDEIEKFAEMFRAGGMGYGTAKTILFEKVDAFLSEKRERYEYLMAHREEIDAALANGAEIARKIANKKIAKVMKVMLG